MDRWGSPSESEMVPITKQDLWVLARAFRAAKVTWPGPAIGLGSPKVYCPDPTVYVTSTSIDSEHERWYLLTGGRWVRVIDSFSYDTLIRQTYICYERRGKYMLQVGRFKKEKKVNFA